MDHRRFEQLLPDYIENNLAGADLTAFNRWLDAHPEAREEVRKLRDLVLEVSDIESDDPGSAFWNRFLPELRTRMDEETEDVRLSEKLRRVVFRPAILGSLGLAAVILILLMAYSDMGPRGEITMEARRVNSRLETALRGAEDDTLAGLEDYFGREGQANDPDAPLVAGGLTLVAASESDAGDWLEPWLEREEQHRLAGDNMTLRLLEELDDEETTQLQEMLLAEMSAG